MGNHSGSQDPQKNLKMLLALSEVSEAIISCAELDSILDTVLNSALEILKFDRVRVYMVDAEKEILKGKAGIGLELYPLKEGVNEIVDAFLRQDCLIFENADKLACYAPLIVRKEKMGILVSDNIRSRRPIEKEDKDYLRILANHLSFAIAISGLYEKVKELSMRDPLTGLYLCNYFLGRLDEEVKRSGRTKHNFSLMIIDIDGFSRYNDVHGRLIGDKVIKFLSDILKRKLRAVDLKTRYTGIIGRCGGDEFVVLLIDTPLDAASVIANRFKDAVREACLRVDNKELSFTVSIGVSEFPSNGTSGFELFKKAGEALYDAKKNGKDRVCLVKDIGKPDRSKEIV